MRRRLLDQKVLTLELKRKGEAEEPLAIADMCVETPSATRPQLQMAVLARATCVRHRLNLIEQVVQLNASNPAIGVYVLPLCRVLEQCTEKTLGNPTALAKLNAMKRGRGGGV